MATKVQTPLQPIRRPRRRMRHAFVVVAAMLAVLVGAETLVRSIEPRLDAPNLWPEAITGEKARQIEAAVANDATAEIVVVGSSVALDGIEPKVLGEGLGTDASVYNAAVPIAQLRSLRRWTEDVVMPNLQPSLVVVAVTSRAFHRVDEGEQYDARLAASTGYRELSGIGNTIAFRIDRQLAEWLAIFRARTALRDFNSSLSALIGREVDPGYELSSSGHRRPDDTAYRIPNEWDPATSPLLEFEMQGRSEMQAMVDTLAAAGTAVLFVNMPVTDDYISLHGTAEYASYVAQYEEWSRTAGAAFIDLSPYVPTGEYWDPAHLTPSGAESVTAALAQEMRRLGFGS